LTSLARGAYVRKAVNGAAGACCPLYFWCENGEIFTAILLSRLARASPLRAAMRTRCAWRGTAVRALPVAKIPLRRGWLNFTKRRVRDKPESACYLFAGVTCCLRLFSCRRLGAFSHFANAIAYRRMALPPRNDDAAGGGRDRRTRRALQRNGDQADSAQRIAGNHHAALSLRRAAGKYLAQPHGARRTRLSGAMCAPSTTAHQIRCAAWTRRNADLRLSDCQRSRHGGFMLAAALQNGKTPLNKRIRQRFGRGERYGADIRRQA